MKARLSGVRSKRLPSDFLGQPCWRETAMLAGGGKIVASDAPSNA
jgi:hypothetical protein